ncbi:MAG: glycosyltransferase family 4 protein [Isosphaeraceae bacterium]
MQQIPGIRKIAFVGDYLPRKCGIATFTHDMYTSIAGEYPDSECFVVPVNDRREGYEYPPEVRFEIDEQDQDSYLRAADFLNFANPDVVCLQHEFGIYGGRAGSHVLSMLRMLRMPVVTTLHTVLKDPDPDQRRVLRELAGLSARIVVMSERGHAFLREVYQIPDYKIDIIPHGIPDMPFVDPSFYKDQFGVEGKNVVLTFGLLSPNKGIEHMLRALPAILEEFPNLVYLVLGATHPNLVREQGESYRLGLERLARDLGVDKNVIFYNRFVELDELIDFIGAADLYVTPYLNPAQITSGTLAYTFGSGKAVVSTPYWHAEELLADGRGVLVPFGDSAALVDAIVGILRDEPRRHAMRKRAYLLGREMVWAKSAQRYMEIFQNARDAWSDSPARSMTVRTLGDMPAELPTWKLDHLTRLTDSTGILQHAVFTFPRHADGYCTDDNARALLLTVLLEELGLNAQVAPLATRYAAFLHHAFDVDLHRFRNFMGYDRRWLEAIGSDDSHGRALWALGVCVGRSRRRDLQYLGAQLFEQALPPILESDSPRGWAFALLGIDEYFRRLTGDRRAAQARDALTARLLELFDQHSTDDWPWFEPILSYDNARLPHALIVAGKWSGNDRAVEVGLRSLRWLCQVQRADSGHFRPVGCNGWYSRGEEPARFDQQPIEAAASVSAYLAAHRATGEPRWWIEARSAFDWFLGRNDLGEPLYDAATGGCRDGLHPDRTNQNQGAESTLSYLTALAEMKLLRGSVASFREPNDLEPDLVTADIRS